MTSDPFKKFLNQNSPSTPVAPSDELEQIMARVKGEGALTADPALLPQGRSRAGWTWSLASGLVAASFVLSFWGTKLLSPEVPKPIGIQVAATPIPGSVSDDELSAFMLEVYGVLEGEDSSQDSGWGEEFLL